MSRATLLGALTVAAIGLNTPAAAQTPPDVNWRAVRELATGSQKVEVEVYGASAVRGRAVAVTDDMVTVATAAGEQRIPRTEIKRVKVPSPTKRLLFGAIGVTGGLVAGYAACPSCANEGNPGRRNALMALGAGAGSAAFLIPATRTIYRGPR